jgi:class 3 adenylate cyclase
VHTFCILKGDVYGYGSLMHARADAPIRQALEDAVRQWARGAAVVEAGSGDSVLVAHDDAVALAQAARHIIDDVYQTTGQPRLRVALHYGDVHIQAGVGDEPPMVVGGDAVLCATRVEPHVLPGQIWATEEFRQQLAQKPSLWRTTAVMAPDGSDRFNVKKVGRAEPDLWVRLYRVEF